MPGKKRKNIIPLNIVQKKKKVTQELISVSIASPRPASSDEGDDHCGYDHEASQCSEDLSSLLANMGGISLDQPAQADVSHEVRQQKMAEKWQEYMPLAYRAVIEGSALRRDEVCCLCGSPGVVRCQQCGSLVFYCVDCAISAHSHRSYHHYPEVWKVHAYSFLL